MKAMAYSIFFTLLSACLLYLTISADSSLDYLLIWPCTSSIMLAFAYAMNQPTLVAGKTGDGRLSLTLTLLNLPWLLSTWAIWYMTIKISKEDTLNQIAHTNITISRYPLPGEINDQYDFIVDLTAEFPASPQPGKVKFYLPWLDGIAPTCVRFPPGISQQSRILIHCAQGHGRSATYAALLLKELGHADSALDAYTTIMQSRPDARLSKDQLHYITNH